MYQLVDEPLIEELEAHPNAKGDWLFLEPHPEFKGQWEVNCFDTHFFFDFKDLIGSYRTVSPVGLKDFLEVAKEREYKVAFFEDPGDILADYEALNVTPDVELNSSFEGTVNGFLNYQVQGYNMLKDLEYAGVARWSTGPQPLWELVLTPNGWRKIGDLCSGDLVIGSEGLPIEVEGIFPQGEKEVWEIEFNDGTSVRCSPDHLWTVDYWTNGSRKLERRQEHRRITKTARELSEVGLYQKLGSKIGKNGRAKYALPSIEPVEFKAPKDLIFDPYCLGLLLGDGSLSSGPGFTTADPELVTALEAVATMVPVSGYDYRVNGIRNILRDLRLLGKRSWEKVIPPEYMYASPDDRLALLQGLLDSDGCVSGSGASFTSTSKILADQVVELCRSLGGYAMQPTERYTNYTHKGEKRQGRISFRTNLSLNRPLFRLQRKEAKRTPFKQRYKRIVGIRPRYRDEKMVCIRVNAADHLYVTRDYALTHNTGKTVLAGGLIQHLLNEDHFDICFVVTKATNKINTQRKLKKIASVESEVIKGLKRKKELKKGTFYPRSEFYERVQTEHGKVLICSYETFKVDFDEMLPLFEGRVLILWDEMPTKLKTRDSELYTAIKHLLFKNDGPSCKRKFFRPEWIMQYMLSATPIENSPEDFYNCVRLMDPDIYGTVTEFRNEYVATYNHFDKHKPETWQKLDKIGMKAAHITHQVDKEDPGIREQFPDVFEDTFYCEWSAQDVKLYNEVLDRCEAYNVNPLATINLLQMVCDEPTMLWDRAEVYAAYEKAYEEWLEIGDGNEPKPEGSKGALDILEGLPKPSEAHGKQMGLRYLLLDRHYGEKTLVFSQANNSLMPTLENRLTEWGVRYVRYNGTERQRQAAEDTFMEDPTIHVFLTSDMGSDSLDLYEGKNVINYNLPWKWTTKTQRANRVNRVISEFDFNNVWTLTYPDCVEERKAVIIDTKRGYHDGVFKGKMSENSASARLTREDLYFMLRGYAGTV
jgi:intein/homing endonuclease